ncbi:hypothetical protein PYW07_000883 [Mythimna separata]|nr:hypothetical protein PYW07_000883 [Mythimna separata]
MNPHYHGYAELSSPHPPSPEAAFAANGHDYPHNNNNPALKECAGCNGKIVERFLLHALDRYWHHGCLKCACCGQALADMGRSFYFKGGMILCKSDYTRMFGSGGACAACGQAIPASEFVMRTNAPQQPLHVFHIKCFACSKCGSHLMQGDRYYMLAGSLVCEQDWQKLMKSANATGAPGAPMRKNKVGHYEEMMSCSYLSAAGMAPEGGGAACWTPPALACPGEGPSMLPPYARPPSLLGLPPAHEPALDLSKPASSLKRRLPSPASDAETE